MFIRFDIIHERDRRTDRQTLHDSIDRACIASRGKNKANYFLSQRHQTATKRSNFCLSDSNCASACDYTCILPIKCIVKCFRQVTFW